MTANPPKLKLAYVSNGPLPYHTPILNELAQFLHLHVVFMSTGHPLATNRDLWGVFEDPWGTPPTFEYSTYWSRALQRRTSDFRSQFSIGVSSLLHKLDPDVVLFTSWGPLVLEPMVWKMLARRKAVIWAESCAFSGILRGPLSNGLRRLLISRADAFVSNGTMATVYLRALGAPQERIVTSRLPSPMGVIEDPLGHKGGKWSTSEAPHFLFVGRLTEIKRPLVVVRAFRKVLTEVPLARLTIVGDGPLMQDVDREARALGGRIELLGRVEGEALRAVYSRSDILVHPAVREVWGLVVNEALANGLYVIASDQVGSAYDLLDNTNGLMVEADNEPALCQAMIAAGKSVPQDPVSRAARAQTVASCTPEAFARAISEAAALALGGPNL